jgi:hypothetical protein
MHTYLTTTLVSFDIACIITLTKEFGDYSFKDLGYVDHIIRLLPYHFTILESWSNRNDAICAKTPAIVTHTH